MICFDDRLKICSVVNFCLGNGWAFAASNPARQSGQWQESISAGVSLLAPIQNRFEDEHSPMNIPAAKRPSASGRPFC
jgi:hypothetical protein